MDVLVINSEPARQRCRDEKANARDGQAGRLCHGPALRVNGGGGLGGNAMGDECARVAADDIICG